MNPSRPCKLGSTMAKTVFFSNWGQTVECNSASVTLDHWKYKSHYKPSNNIIWPYHFPSFPRKLELHPNGESLAIGCTSIIAGMSWVSFDTINLECLIWQQTVGKTSKAAGSAACNMYFSHLLRLIFSLRKFKISWRLIHTLCEVKNV